MVAIRCSMPNVMRQCSGAALKLSDHAAHTRRNCNCRYSMTKFAVSLNELTPGLEERIAPTDSRLRPDQRALEDGVYDQVCFYLPCTRKLSQAVAGNDSSDSKSSAGLCCEEHWRGRIVTKHI